MQRNVHVPGHTAHSQPATKLRQISATFVWQDKSSEKKLSGFMVYKYATWLHCDEANDLTFCMVAYKDGKLTLITLTKHLSSMNFRTRRMLVLPSRNTIFQSAMIGIDKIFCLFGLRLYVPVNNFSVMSGRSHRFLGITSTFLGGIDKNKQCDYLTCIQRKNRRYRLEGSNCCSIFSGGVRNTFEYSFMKCLYNKPNFTSKNGHKMH